MVEIDMAVLMRREEAPTLIRAALDGAGVAANLQDGMIRYLVDGVRPGSFLTAVLENNLSDAVLRAAAEGDGKTALIVPVVLFLIYNAPSPSFGSREAVDAWVANRQAMRSV